MPAIPREMFDGGSTEAADHGGAFWMPEKAPLSSLEVRRDRNMTFLVERDNVQGSSRNLCP